MTTGRRAAEADLRLELARTLVALGPTRTKVIAAEAETVLAGVPVPSAMRLRQAAQVVRRLREAEAEP